MVPSILPESSATDDSEWHRDTACEPSKRNDKEVKAQQARKIRELGDALVLHGFRTLDQQAKALGLGRTTAWTILKATIRNPASRQRSSIACWLHRGFLRLSATKSLNTSMKKSQALTAIAKHRYNDLPLVCQARVLTKPERTRKRILGGRDAGQTCVSMNSRAGGKITCNWRRSDIGPTVSSGPVPSNW